MCVLVHLCVRVCMRVYLHMCVHVRLCMRVHMCVRVYVHTNVGTFTCNCFNSNISISHYIMSTSRALSSYISWAPLLGYLMLRNATPFLQVDMCLSVFAFKHGYGCGHRCECVPVYMQMRFCISVDSTDSFQFFICANRDFDARNVCEIKNLGRLIRSCIYTRTQMHSFTQA